MESKSTHFIFDSDKIIISPDLREAANFLCKIGEELDSFLYFDKKLESIMKQYRETLELVKALAKKIKENSIDFKFTLSENPATIGDKFKFYNPLRFQIISLFAELEVLMRLNYAYDNKIDDGKIIREMTMKKEVWKCFYNDYCLNRNNEWVKDNMERTNHITAIELRYLRNSLTHFLSVDTGIQIADDQLNDKARKLEKKTKFKFISPQDLCKINKGAGLLVMKKWSDDCKKCLSSNSNDFKERILSVNNLIKNSGANILYGDQIDI